MQNNQTRDWLCIDPSPLQLVYSGGTFRICRCCRCRCPSLRRSKIREEIARPSSRKSELLRRQMTSEMGKVKMSENDIDEKLAASVVAQLAHRSLPNQRSVVRIRSWAKMYTEHVLLLKRQKIRKTNEGFLKRRNKVQTKTYNFKNSQNVIFKIIK